MQSFPHFWEAFPKQRHTKLQRVLDRVLWYQIRSMCLFVCSLSVYMSMHVSFRLLFCRPLFVLRYDSFYWGKAYVVMKRGGERAVQNHEMSSLAWEVLTFCGRDRESERQREWERESRILGSAQTERPSCIFLSYTMWFLHLVGHTESPHLISWAS